MSVLSCTPGCGAKVGSKLRSALNRARFCAGMPLAAENWPMPRHVRPGWQVTLVEPGLSTQLSGGLLEKSALELLVAFCGCHAGVGLQLPLVQ